jgi:hypothetical protein
MRGSYPSKIKQATFIIVNTSLPPQREVDHSPSSMAPTGLHVVERWTFLYIEQFFLWDFLIKIVHTFIVCVMHDSLHGKISGNNRCITLEGRYKWRACQYLWDTTVQYCTAPSVIRACKTYSYKSEVVGWCSARHESPSCIGLLTPLQRLGLQMTTARGLDRATTVIVHCLPHHNYLHPSLVMSCLCRMCK